MKDCMRCIWFDSVLNTCGNYLCRNQSEYDEYRREHENDGGNAGDGPSDRRVPVL